MGEKRGKKKRGPELSEKEKKLVKSYDDRLKRLQADFENYRKRIAKEKEEMMGKADVRVIASILPFLDELEIATQSAARSIDSDMGRGVLLLYEKFLDTLRKSGVREIDVLGRKADPFTCEVAVEEESDKEEGTVVRVIRKGYALRGNVIRHAIVSVAKRKR
jgi:molecular chaperone GrpE